MGEVVLYVFETLTTYIKDLVSTLKPPILASCSVREHLDDEDSFLE